MTLSVGSNILSQHPARFCVHELCGGGDINRKCGYFTANEDIHYCLGPLTSIIIIFCKAYDMSCAKRLLSNSLINNLYGKVFRVSTEISPILVTCFLGNE